MKKINKLLLTGFILTGTLLAFNTVSIFAMDDGIAQEEARSASRSVTPALLFEETGLELEETNSLLGLPNELIMKIIAHYIEDKYLQEKNQESLLKNIGHAFAELALLKTTSKKPRLLFPTRKDIIHTLRTANIAFYANEINAETGEALLHKTLRMGYIAVARILIQAGADVNLALITAHDPQFNKRFPVGSTPLHIAAAKGYDKIVDLLIKYSTNITATTTSSSHPDLNNITALDLARNNGHMAVIAVIENAYQQRHGATPAPIESDIPEFNLDGPTPAPGMEAIPEFNLEDDVNELTF